MQIVKVQKSNKKIKYIIKQKIILPKPKVPLKFFVNVHSLNYRLINEECHQY